MPVTRECDGRAAVDPVGLSNAINQPRFLTVAAVLALADFLTFTNFLALSDFFALADTLSDTITKVVADSEIFPKTQSFSGPDA